MKRGVLFHCFSLTFRKGVYFKSYFALLCDVGRQSIRIYGESQRGYVSRKGHIELNIAQIIGITYSINKRPKWPHIVHLSTMCHLFEESAKADIFVYWSARKTQTRKRMLRSCFLSSFVEFRSAVLEKMSQPIRGQGGHLVFPIGPKNTNLVEDVEILLPVKFRWIPFNGFRGEVENVSANQRPGRPSCFSDRPEKHKLGRGGWDLASY